MLSRWTKRSGEPALILRRPGDASLMKQRCRCSTDLVSALGSPLRDQRHVDAVIKDVIDELEHHEQRSLGAQDRKSVEEVIRAAVGAPHEAEADAENGSASLDPDAHIRAALAELQSAEASAPE